MAAVDLDGAVGHLEGDAARLLVGEGGLAQGVDAAVEGLGRLPGEQARAVDLDRHVGELEGDGLLAGDRHAEGVALLGVVARDLEGRARDAHRAGGQGDAAAVDDLRTSQPASPSSRAEAGTRTPSSASSAVGRALRPMLRSAR